MASCRTDVELADLDRTLRTSEAQTIVVADDFTLYAPFGIIGARGYAELAKDEMKAVGDLFGTRLDAPLPIWLRPARGVRPRVEIDGQRVRMIPADVHPHHGVEAYADGTAVALYVEEEVHGRNAKGEPTTGQCDPETYRTTLRHELAHIWAARSALRGGSWFDEGLAEHVESMTLAQGRLVPDERCALVRAAARVSRESRAIARLLAWSESGRRVHEGVERADIDARVASGAFVHFMMARLEGETFLERARKLHALARAELLEREDEWQRWCASLAD